MDYLFYVERNAEPLQFFLWYWDYVQRWSTLLPRQKALSPPWDPEKAAEPASRFIRYSHKRARSQKMSKVIAIMEMEMDSERTTADPTEQSDKGTPSPSSSPTTLHTPSSAILSPIESTKSDFQACT